MQAIILAAGLGTRMKPVTDKVPKALVPVNTGHGVQKPMLELLLDKLALQGFTHIVVNVHHFAGQIRTFISDYLERKELSLHICLSDETDLLRDTGGALRKARALLDPSQPFLIHNVDIISDIDAARLVACHQATDSLATLVVSQRDTPRQFLFDDRWRLAGWTNTMTGQVRRVAGHSPAQACHTRAFAGIHVMSQAVMPLMDTWPEVFSVIDFYLEQAGTHTVRGMEIPGLRITDIGKPESLRNITL